MANEKYSKECFTCGGYYDDRFKDEPCPECGRWGKGTPVATEIAEKKEDVIKVAEVLDIPREYQGIEWSRELLQRDHRDEMDNINFQRYCNQLEKIHELFGMGIVPNKSAFITAPPGYSKITWAYSCMQLAIARNHSVDWLLDTIEVKRLMVLASENPKYKLYNKVDYDQYMIADVCFITVTKTEYSQDSFKVIQEILDRRSRKGLATFILSRFDFKAVSRKDYLHHFDAIIDRNGNQNPLKYPAFITYWKSLM